MVALNKRIVADKCRGTGTGGIVKIPQGKYQAIIVKSVNVQNSKKTGNFLALTVIITQGEFKDTEFTERLNLKNPSPMAVKIAEEKMAEILDALLMKEMEDSVEIHNKPLIINVQTKAGEPWMDSTGAPREGKDKSIIKNYLPLPADGASPFGNAPAPAAAPAIVPALLPPEILGTTAAPTTNPFAPPTK